MMATPGRCYLNVAIMNYSVMEDYIQNALIFDVQEGVNCGASKREWHMCGISQEWQFLSDELLPDDAQAVIN
jgi:hypothetical protein